MAWRVSRMLGFAISLPPLGLARGLVRTVHDVVDPRGVGLRRWDGEACCG
jgi:hypothetical protein